jgi:hypothetical protein
MVISTPGPRLTRHDLVKVTAEYTVMPKDNIALEQLHFLRIQRYFQVQFAKLKTGLC